MTYTHHVLEQVSQARTKRNRFNEKQERASRRFERRVRRIGAERRSNQGFEELDSKFDDSTIKQVERSKPYNFNFDNHEPFRANSDAPTKLIVWYFWTLILRLFLETAFSYAQFKIYPYTTFIGTEFECQETYPCTSDTTHCWPVRPFEKTIWIWVWLSITGSCLLMTFVEIMGIGYKQVSRGYKNQEDITKEFRIGRKTRRPII